MVYIGNSLSANQCVTDCGSEIIFFALVRRDECMMQECWTHLASMFTWHSLPFPLLDRRCVSTGIWHILYVPISSAPSDMGC